jgi:cell division protein FtsB
MKKHTYLLFLVLSWLVMSCGGGSKSAEVQSVKALQQNEEADTKQNQTQEQNTTQEQNAQNNQVVMTDEKQLEEAQNNTSQANSTQTTTPQNSFALEGTRKLQLQWIEKPGKARIEVGQPGAYNINGSVTNNDDYLTINGEIIPLDANRFKFVGVIESRVSYINNGQPCVRKATEDNFFVFLKKGGRKFYRLQQMNNCEGNNVVDYIDIYE